MTTLKVGIASLDQFRDYTMAIARGEYKRKPDEPKVNLSRTLKTLEYYNLVHFEKGKGRTRVPRTPYTDVVLDVSLQASRVGRRTLIPA